MKHTILIGITGGMGSGKTTLSNKLRAKGYFVYDSDLEAKRLQNESPKIKKQLIEIFGNDIYNEAGLNRQELARLVFANSELLAKLNQIVHPVVRDDFKSWIKNHASEKLLFIESAILIESGFYLLVDKIILMTASEEVRIGRIIKRDHVSLEQVMARMSHQLPDRIKLKVTDFVIHTDDDLPMDDKMEKILNQILLEM